MWGLSSSSAASNSGMSIPHNSSSSANNSKQQQQQQHADVFKQIMFQSSPKVGYPTNGAVSSSSSSSSSHQQLHQQLHHQQQQQQAMKVPPPHLQWNVEQLIAAAQRQTAPLIGLPSAPGMSNGAVPAQSLFANMGFPAAQNHNDSRSFLPSDSSPFSPFQSMANGPDINQMLRSNGGPSTPKFGSDSFQGAALGPSFPHFSFPSNDPTQQLLLQQQQQQQQEQLQFQQHLLQWQQQQQQQQSSFVPSQSFSHHHPT